MRTSASAQRMNGVDDKAMDGSTKAERPRADQECDDVEQKGQMRSNVQAVVERQHQQVSGQDGNVIPHEMLLEDSGWTGAGFLQDPAKP